MDKIYRQARAIEERIAAVLRDGARFGEVDALMREAGEMVRRQREEITAQQILVDIARKGRAIKRSDIAKARSDATWKDLDEAP